MRRAETAAAFLMAASLFCGFVSEESAAPAAPAAGARPRASVPQAAGFEVQAFVTAKSASSITVFRNDVSDPPLELVVGIDAQTAYEGALSSADLHEGSEVVLLLTAKPAAQGCRAARVRLVTSREDVAKNLRSAKLYNLTRHLAVTNLPDDIAKEAGIASLRYEERPADDKAREALPEARPAA